MRDAVDGNDGLIAVQEARIEGLESQVELAIPNQLGVLGDEIDAAFGEIVVLDEDLDAIDGRVTVLEQLPAPPVVVGATLLLDANDKPIAVPVNIGNRFTPSTHYGFAYQGRAYHFRVERFKRSDGVYELFFERNNVTAWLYFESSDCSGDAYYALTNGDPLFGEAPEGATGGSLPVHVVAMPGSAQSQTLILGGELLRLDFRKWMPIVGSGGCQGFGRASVSKEARLVIRLVDIPSETPEPLALLPGFEWAE